MNPYASWAIWGIIFSIKALIHFRTGIIPVTAQQLLWISLAMSLSGMLFNKDSNIGHSAHLGGLLTGVAYYYFMVRSGRFF